MAISYSVDSTGTTMRSGHRYTSGLFNDTYNNSRAFMKFDLSGAGLSVDGIESIELRTYVSAVFGGQESHRLRSAIDPNGWGAVLEATAADFTSTATNIEVSSKAISSTGWQAWSCNKNNLDLTGFTYYRISAIHENDKTYRYADFSTQNAAGNHPVLRITLTSGVPLYFEASTP